MADRKLAVVTGASSGIGLELARCAARDGCDLFICADHADISAAAEDLRGHGGTVEAVQADLSTEAGVQVLWDRLAGREVDYLMANAGLVLGHKFVEQDWNRVRELIGLNIMGTTLLLHLALTRMKARGEGRVLITGSIAGFAPGSHLAVYSASKAYLDSLSYALRDEMAGTGVTVTCLMPGPVDTGAFEKGDMEGSVMAEAPAKDDPAHVARAGYDAMLAGKSGITPGLSNKVIATLSGVVPEPVLARISRWMAEPDEGKS